MKLKTLETLVWVLIYGGLLTLCLGLFVTPAAGVLRAALMLAGGVAAAAGVVLIFVRARLNHLESTEK